MKIAFVVFLCHLTSLTGSKSLQSQRLPKAEIFRTVPLMYETDVYNGNNYLAKVNEVPYIVALDFRSPHMTWFCAGSIVSNQWILTVATCTTGATHVNISYGAADRRKPFFQIRVPSSSIFPHPDFDRRFRNDIALIRTPRLNYLPVLAAIALCESPALFTNVWTNTAGWGQPTGNSRNNLQLHMLKIEVTANKICTRIGYGRWFRAEMICGQLPMRESSCYLNSGSPMVLQRPQVLIGIASFGNQKDCRSNTPFGYTRISSYTSWIDSMMRRID